MFVMKGIVVDDREVKERFVRAIGADGQNRRRKATAVELRFSVSTSSLPADMKGRVIALGGKHVSQDGTLTIVSRRYRSQLRNREAAREQFLDLLRRASKPPKPRIATG
jgi:ribosome-associated protein